MSETTTKKTPVKRTVKDVQKFFVSNTEVVIGDSFEVIPKYDADANSGFKQFGTSKLLMAGVKELHGIPYDTENALWDTGFEEYSTCNRAIPKTELKETVRVYHDLVKQPFETKHRKDVSSTNDKFWDDYMYELYKGKIFDTKNPKDLFDLYNALKQGTVCEPGEKDPFLQRKAQYNIRNKRQVNSFQEEKRDAKMEAMFTFASMLETVSEENDKLYTILEWLMIPGIRGADKDTLKRTVLRQFEDEKKGHEFVKRFLEAYKMTDSEQGQKEMELFSIVTKLNNKRKLEYKRSQYYLDGELLGNTLKAAAKAATINSKLMEIIMDAYNTI